MSFIPEEAYVIIIGAMKSGTTSLYSYLAKHPEICECRIKEPEYFTQHQSHGVREKKYEELWNFDGTTHRYVLESSTGYTKYPSEKGVPAKISEYGIKPRFIYILRDPFERIESHFNAGRFNPEWNHSILDEHLINVSNYYMQLQRFREYFPRDRVLLLDFCELVTSPESVLRRVYSFLELDDSIVPDSYDIENKTISSTKLDIAYKKLVRAIGINRIIPEPLKRVCRRLISGTEPVPKRLLTFDERKIVYGILKGDMIKLCDEYGFDTDKWGFGIEKGYDAPGGSSFPENSFRLTTSM
jgi:hypothetical protein